MRAALCRRAGTKHVVPTALLALTPVLLAIRIARAACANSPRSLTPAPTRPYCFGRWWSFRAMRGPRRGHGSATWICARSRAHMTQD